MECIVTVRPTRAEDASFLYALYASTRAAELALLDWDAAQQAAFLTMQFTAQERYHRTVYADAERRIILVDGHPVGRMDVERQPRVILLMGFVLLPEYRGRGIGSHALRALLDEATRAGTPVRLHVEPTNPAHRLYTRLGFRRVANDGPYWLMEWAPSPSG